MRSRNYLLFFVLLIIMQALSPSAWALGNWSGVVFNSKSFGALVIDPTNPSTVYALMTDNSSTIYQMPYKRTDGGINWTLAQNGLTANVSINTLVTAYIKAPMAGQIGRWTALAYYRRVLIILSSPPPPGHAICDYEQLAVGAAIPLGNTCKPALPADAKDCPSCSCRFRGVNVYYEKA